MQSLKRFKVAPEQASNQIIISYIIITTVDMKEVTAEDIWVNFGLWLIIIYYY